MSSKKVDETTLDEMRKWQKVDSRMDVEFNDLKLELANEFRLLLGISSN
jgi:hypothetical protein